MDTAIFEIDIIYNDSSIVVVKKPGGLLSVPGRGPDKQDCLVNRIKDKFPECIPQPSVHRLDMGRPVDVMHGIPSTGQQYRTAHL